MTQDEIIEMARDSGMDLYGLGKDRYRFVHYLEAFAKLVAAKAITELERQETNHVTLTQTNVGIGERGMEAYEAAKKRGWVGLSDERLMEMPKQEPVALPCCGYADASAVKWNPLNDVVQCHNCGQTYTPPPQRTWVGLPNGEMIELSEMELGAWDLILEVEAKLKERNT
jgi:myo-inositol catabolism protein IolC